MQRSAIAPLVLAASLVAPGAGAQVLSTADTLGQGAQSVFVSENRIFVDGARLHIIVGQYVRGVRKDLDVYVLVASTRTDDEVGEIVLSQASIGGGANWKLGDWHGFSASLFGVASLPINRRNQASDVLANPAIIVSRVVIPDHLALYSGVNALVPIGHRSRGWFTPPDTKVNVPAGALFMLGKWGLFAEADIGHLKAMGAGLARGF